MAYAVAISKPKCNSCRKPATHEVFNRIIRCGFYCDYCAKITVKKLDEADAYCGISGRLSQSGSTFAS